MVPGPPLDVDATQDMLDLAAAQAALRSAVTRLDAEDVPLAVLAGRVLATALVVPVRPPDVGQLGARRLRAARRRRPRAAARRVRDRRRRRPAGAPAGHRRRDRDRRPRARGRRRRRRRRAGDGARRPGRGARPARRRRRRASGGRRHRRRRRGDRRQAWSSPRTGRRPWPRSATARRRACGVLAPSCSRPGTSWSRPARPCAGVRSTTRTRRSSA